MPHAKRIALVYDAIFPYVKGGGERRFYEVAQALAKDGHDVHLYGMKFWDGPNVITRGGVTLHGLCKARPLYTKSGRRAMLQPVIFGLSCFKLFGQRFDVIDCCGFPYFSIFACRIVTLVKRKPLHATWHEAWGREYWREYLGKLGLVGYTVERLALRMPNVIIAVSDHTAEGVHKLAGIKRPVHVIENGIHVDHIQSVPAHVGSTDIVYVGRLTHTKRIDMLLKAVAEVAKSRPKVRCLIVGHGPERENLQQLAIDLGIKHQVTFTDFREDHDDVIAFMKAGKVFVLPSIREGFGLVAIEANAAGVPVITVDHPANAARKLITGRNGQVTKLESQALASAITEALDGAYRAEDCIAAARQYDWDNIVHKFEEVLL
ncbi:MAG TPA: glycosyltransferase family 4 protein [Bacillota bacterium]|nr:glycosyltransferase family 4 protein [Bacillota bacterium]